MKGKQPVKKLTKLGFGSARERFDITGVNPSLDPVRSRQPIKVGPTSYNPHKYESRYKQVASDIEPWKRKLMLELYSNYRGFRAGHLLEEKKEMEKMGGPGRYIVSYEIMNQQSNLAVDSVGFGKDTRFKKPKMFTPGPGSHNPKLVTFKSWHSKLQTLERDNIQNRFKDPEPSFRIPPNKYNPVDTKSIEAYLKRRVSHLKNMYQCFTGPRDETTIKNYFSVSSCQTPDTFYDTPGSFDTMLKDRKGIFLKANRFPRKPCIRILLASLSNCYRHPREPGPAQYDTTKYGSIIAKEVRYAQDVLDVPPVHAFTSSDWESRTRYTWSTEPGPGRYFKMPTVTGSKRGTKVKTSETSVFRSKTQRVCFPPPPDYSLFTSK